MANRKRNQNVLGRDGSMSIIFVGSTVDRDTLKELKDASVAGNKMELGLVKGFLNNGIPTIALSVEAHGMWKMNHQPIFVKGKHLKDENADIITVPYINIPVIKQISIIRNLKKKLKEYLAESTYREATLIVYNTMTIFTKPVLDISRQEGVKCIAVVADLPIKFKKNFLRRMEDERQIRAISSFDALIALTEHIAKDFAPNTPYCVVEAGCDPDDYKNQQFDPPSDSIKTIVFSGTLNELSGIELLLDAMLLIKDPGVVLNIYGDGPLRQYVEEQSRCRANVNYFGRVSNDQMLKIQSNASLLVCPRKADDFTTKYTFPSKVLEYICAGAPVLANRLMGIPSEYENYISYAESESPEAWAQKMNQILSDENYEKYISKALLAKETVLKAKSWDIQTRRVIDCFAGEGNCIE